MPLLPPLWTKLWLRPSKPAFLSQMMAAVRCKVSKWPFLIGTLFGKRWPEEKLFRLSEEVGPEPAAALERYREAIARWAQYLCSRCRH